MRVAQVGARCCASVHARLQMGNLQEPPVDVRLQRLVWVRQRREAEDLIGSTLLAHGNVEVVEGVVFDRGRKVRALEVRVVRAAGAGAERRAYALEQVVVRLPREAVRVEISHRRGLCLLLHRPALREPTEPGASRRRGEGEELRAAERRGRCVPAQHHPDRQRPHRHQRRARPGNTPHRAVRRGSC